MSESSLITSELKNTTSPSKGLNPVWPGMLSRLAARWQAQVLLAAVAGVSLALAFAPFNQIALIPIAFLSLALLLYRQPPSRAILIGWAFGCGLFGAGVHWIYVSIHTHGNAPVWLAASLTGLFAVAMALFVALPCWVAAHLSRARRQSFLEFMLVLGALWVLGEAFRSWFLTGFPWLLAGTALIETPLAGFAPVGGVFLLSALAWLMVAGSWLLLLAIWPSMRRGSLRQSVSPTLAAGRGQAEGKECAGSAVQRTGHKRRLWLGTALLTLPILSGALLNLIEWTRDDGAPIQVGILQPNVAQQDKWKQKHLRPQVHQLMDMTSSLQYAELIIWPETALPMLDIHAQSVLELIDRAALERNQSVILGLLTARMDSENPSPGNLRIYNSVRGLGKAEGTYSKHKLVPFGEYVPLENWLRGLIAFFDLPMSAMAAETGPVSGIRLGDRLIQPYICYEIVYPDYVASAAGAAQVLLTVSNDTWFGDSIGPLQHFQIARFRALENGKPLIRGTNNGVSALVDAKGRTHAQIPQFGSNTLLGEVQPRTGRTPFSVTGSWPVLGSLVIALAVLLRRRHPGAQDLRKTSPAH